MLCIPGKESLLEHPKCTCKIQNIILENRKTSTTTFMLSFSQMPIYLLPPVLWCLREPSLRAGKKFVPWLLPKSISLPGRRKTYIFREYYCQKYVTRTMPGFIKCVSRHCLRRYGVKEKFAFQKQLQSRGRTIAHFHFLG